jgi:hypothetical protein
MWEQYKKTAVGIQIVIGIVTIGILILTRRFAAGGMFFTVMQLSALLGAGWATRLHRLQERGRLLRAART